jgi:hypothetical protein
VPKKVDLLLGHDDGHRPLPQPLPLPMQHHAFHTFVIRIDRNTVTKP